MISFDDDLQENFFIKSISFFTNFRWLIDFKWTNILIDDLLEKVPTTWLQHISRLDAQQVNLLLNKYELAPEAPEDLKAFVRQCDELSLRLKWPQFALPANKNTKKLNKKISAKKSNEVECLLKFILNICREELKTSPGNVTILDIGAGLGYISECLHGNGFTVIGVEAQLSLCESANSRYEQDKIRFLHMTFDQSRECIETIKSILPQDRPVIVIGLHCCGNLLNSIIQLYSQVPQIKAMVCVTCCYHLMTCDEFPRSTTLNQIALQHNFAFSLPILRLGCQDPPQRWSRDLSDIKLKLHEKSAFYRALLEKFTKESDSKWTRPMKKNLHSKLDGTITDYVESIIMGFEGKLINHTSN